MPIDVLSLANSGQIINNGAAITFKTNIGTYKKLDPEINAYIPSGITVDRLKNRFITFYGGPPSGYPPN